jgi:hypothetical protein
MLRSTFKARTVAAALLLAAGVTVGCATAQTGNTAATGNPSRPVLAQANMPAHTTGQFKGIKAHIGHAIHSTVSGRQILAVSDDFVIPDTPAPHWQVVDSQGNVYLLQQFKIKDGKYNRQITLPTYVNDVAKVQVWCSYAEALLGEASFETPVK